MDTRFLETFLVTVDSGSMAEAARRLNVTPAAIAQRIRVLEDELGSPLIARSGRVVGATEAGMAILARSREILRDVRNLRILAAGDTLSGELRLGAISTALTGILPPILSRLSRTLRQVGIYVVPGASVELYQKFLEGDLQAVVMVHPHFALPKTCEWRTIRREPLVVLAPSSLEERDPHRLLTTQPFIRYDRHHWGGRLGEHYLRRQGLYPKERFELDSLEAIAVLVDSGLGVSLVPDWAPPWPQGLSLKKHQLPGIAPQREIGVVWMRGSPAIKLIRAFLLAVGVKP